MYRFLRFILPGLAILLSVSCGNDPDVPYEVPETPWPESFGNHRAVLSIDNPAEVVRIEPRKGYLLYLKEKGHN